MRLPQLKVKIKSLSAESRIIRHQEYKQRDIARSIVLEKGKTKAVTKENDKRLIEKAKFYRLNNELHLHRTNDVRVESRHSQLAYGFLRGTKYKSIENKCYEQPQWSKVESIALRFGMMDERDLKQKFAEWKEG